MSLIYVTPTGRRVYDAVYKATDQGARTFEGHPRVDKLDCAQLTREIHRLVRLGVIASEAIDPRVVRHGRRMRALVPPTQLEIAGHEKRAGRKPEVEEDVDVRRERHANAMARFDEAFRAAFPQGADYRRGAWPQPATEEAMA